MVRAGRGAVHAPGPDPATQEVLGAVAERTVEVRTSVKVVGLLC